MTASPVDVARVRRAGGSDAKKLVAADDLNAFGRSESSRDAVADHDDRGRCAREQRLQAVVGQAIVHRRERNSDVRSAEQGQRDGPRVDVDQDELACFGAGEPGTDVSGSGLEFLGGHRSGGVGHDRPVAERRRDDFQQLETSKVVALSVVRWRASVGARRRNGTESPCQVFIGSPTFVGMVIVTTRGSRSTRAPGGLVTACRSRSRHVAGDEPEARNRVVPKVVDPAEQRERVVDAAWKVIVMEDRKSVV